MLTQCIDIGANLTNKRFAMDLEKVLLDAKNAGVGKIVVTGTSAKSSAESVELCENNPGELCCTVGVHPHEAKEFDSNVALGILRDLCKHASVVAVGECGLDFNRDFSPRPNQEGCFEHQIDLASEVGLPMFLHERDAFDTFLGIMKNNRRRVQGGVVHCFTGTKAQARAYLDLDLHLGVTGWICDERRGSHLREVVKMIPADRLMIETDCPYLAPRDYRPKIGRNEPKYLPHILEVVASCRGESVADLAPKILNTTNLFFGIS